VTVRIISDNEAGKSLEDYLDFVAEDQIPTVITNASGHHVVVLTLSDYQSMEETIHLLSSPVNATRLNESIAQFQAATAG
jgi:antitoxin YefM